MKDGDDGIVLCIFFVMVVESHVFCYIKQYALVANAFLLRHLRNTSLIDLA
jgi:hypothetical protein